MFFIIFPSGVPGQVWQLIVLIPDLYLLLYFAIFTEVCQGDTLFTQVENKRLHV